MNYDELNSSSTISDLLVNMMQALQVSLQANIPIKLSEDNGTDGVQESNIKKMITAFDLNTSIFFDSSIKKDQFIFKLMAQVTEIDLEKLLIPNNLNVDEWVLLRNSGLSLMKWDKAIFDLEKI